jgi:hypothetical protein
MDWKSSLDRTFSDDRSKRKLLGLLLFWLIGILSVVGYTAWSGRLMGETDSEAEGWSTFDRNETGALTAWRRSPSHQGAPTCKIVLDNLRAENGSLGIFKTASLKVVYLDHLRATFFTEGSKGGASTLLCDFYDLFAPRRAGPDANPLGLFHETEGLDADWSVPVDMTNTTEVRIRRLDWKVLGDDTTLFQVRCQHATLRSDSPRIVLRGHVTVTTPSGVLESNCIAMDTRDEFIIVPGRYSLDSDGTVRTGCGQRFSRSLEPTDGHFADMEGEHGWANGFVLGSY